MRRYQLGLLIALSLGMTGCQSSGSSWSPSTWSWNPWASKDTAVAKSDTKPALPSAEATKPTTPPATTVASRNTPAATAPAYPTTGAPAPNFAVPAGGYATTNAAAAQPAGGYPTTAGGYQAAPTGGYGATPAGGYAAAQPAPVYGTQPAGGAAPAGGYPNNTTVPAGYMGNGMGGYGQTQPAANAYQTPSAPNGAADPNAGYRMSAAPNYGAATSPTAYGAAQPAYNPTPNYNTVPSAYGQQPYAGQNPYAQPPAQPGATPGVYQGSSTDMGGAAAGLAAATPARNNAPFTPGSIKTMSATGLGAAGNVNTAGFEAKVGENTATASTAYGSMPAGMTCENGICYPNGSTTTAAPTGYSQPAFGTSSPAPATNAGGSFYR